MQSFLVVFSRFDGLNAHNFLSVALTKLYATNFGYASLRKEILLHIVSYTGVTPASR